VLSRLRERIRALEQQSPAGGPLPTGAWTLGIPEIDSHLGPQGLASGGLHEIKPWDGGAAAHASALTFTLRMIVRHLKSSLPGQASRPGRILWCSAQESARDTGRLYGLGLAALGIDPGLLLLVETARTAETLWALEEGLKSASLSLAVGILPEIALTPARRLALCAKEHATPALLMTGARNCATAATATRWRVAPARSAAHPLAAEALGHPRLSVMLERCRNTPQLDMSQRILEWCHETHRFRVASSMADRASPPSLDVHRIARGHTG
jgi:protein ImuA